MKTHDLDCGCKQELTMNGYQASAIKTAVYIKSTEEITDDPALRSLLRLLYVTSKLAGEAGELLNKVGKIIRDHKGVITEEMCAGLAFELGDVQWYTAALAAELGYTLEQVAMANLDKLARREGLGTLRGSGDTR